MQTLFSPLFKPFAAVNYPIRYFLLLFLAITGVLQLMNELYINIVGTEFWFARSISYPLVFSVLIFISRYFKHKKSKQMSAQTIAS
jgi:hypothetical protein